MPADSLSRANRSKNTPDPFNITPHHYPQIWFLVVTFAVFGIYIAWDLNFLTIVFALDRSYITSVIAAVVILSTSHAAWHIVSFSRRVEEARLCLRQLKSRDPVLLHADIGFVSRFLHDLDRVPSARNTGGGTSDSDSVIEIYADRLRSPVDLGWFVVDLAIRLGLVGTIIGFILIFTSLSDGSISGAEGLKQLMVSMSGGMGTALLTTLSGLVGATFLSFQYLILGREVEHLIGQLIRVRNRYVNHASA